MTENSNTKKYMYKGDIFPFGGRYKATMDMDSFYFGYEQLKSLVEIFGTATKFDVDNIKQRISSSTSSRFGMVLTPENEVDNHVNPIRIKVAVYKANQLGLNYIPNIKIMECQIPGVSQKCHINMYFIGTKYSSKNSYFTDVSVRAITLLLNTARNTLLNFAVDARRRGCFDSIDIESFSMMPSFESKTGGNQDQLMKNKKFVMTSRQATSFAAQIDQSLSKYVSDITFDDFKKLAKDPLLTGHSLYPFVVSDDIAKQMFDFLQRLAKGVYFTANCAGFKEDYHSREEYRETFYWNRNDSELQTWMETQP